MGAESPDTPMLACWSCRGPASVREMFCRTCGAVQPPGQIDHFSRLGLDAAFAIDPALIERRYFEQQRQLHPDRFATRSPRERALSQSQATAINEAYETLKDPLRRAGYLLQTRHAADGSAGVTHANDPDLLLEAMELREALEDAGTPEAVRALAQSARVDIERCVANVADAFARSDFDEAARLTTRLTYLHKLTDDCRARLQRRAGR
ncbi:MAG: Fe-S protein assembly co-chaperone HscB [Rhodospirillales bacterium]|nr:Fe-S protein assembly co-chaperone HscB [Rhodospirillales bacterium]